MSNIHTPHRLDGESFKAYKERRSASKTEAERISLSGAFDHSRGAESSRESLRNEQRKTGTMRKIAGAFGRGLRNKFTNKPSKGRI